MKLRDVLKLIEVYVLCLLMYLCYIIYKFYAKIVPTQIVKRISFLSKIILVLIYTQTC